jgi:intracellular sulfur oxidation DsrE/DsrF family protein
MISTVIIINKKGMGSAPEDLGNTLINNYLRLLIDEQKLPAALLFYGEGVKLVCNGSHVSDYLKALESKGVQLIACKTCLQYFELIDHMNVGKIGTMADILTLQFEADKVITL